MARKSKGVLSLGKVKDVVSIPFELDGEKWDIRSKRVSLGTSEKWGELNEELESERYLSDDEIESIIEDECGGFTQEEIDAERRELSRRKVPKYSKRGKADRLKDAAIEFIRSHVLNEDGTPFIPDDYDVLDLPFDLVTGISNTVIEYFQRRPTAKKV